VNRFDMSDPFELALRVGAGKPGHSRPLCWLRDTMQRRRIVFLLDVDMNDERRRYLDKAIRDCWKGRLGLARHE
jgi:hypothetical protein